MDKVGTYGTLQFSCKSYIVIFQPKLYGNINQGNLPCRFSRLHQLKICELSDHCRCNVSKAGRMLTII